MAGHKEVIVQLSKQTLILYEHELLKLLPEDLHEKAIKRGKRYLRAKGAADREFRDQNIRTRVCGREDRVR